MLLTISTTHRPATDLGYLLHKNPARVQTFSLNHGQAYVFYPEVTDERCTAALLLDIDPVALVRGKPGGQGVGALDQYVNDRPFVASSFMSVALSRVFGSALSGSSRERPELAERLLPLEATVAAMPCRGGEPLLRRLFEPLGYTVTAERALLDERFPEWGYSPYFTVGIAGNVRLRDLLTHLYVLIPVLDDDKHYGIGEDEMEKLLRKGGGWLAAHPERELITNRYLQRRRRLVSTALARLTEEDQPDPDAVEAEHAAEETAVEEKVGLGTQRMGAVLAALRAAGARRVLGLGCGEGRLLRDLLADSPFTEIVGLDTSHSTLQTAARRLRLERMPERQRARITLLHGSLIYRDRRLEGFDAAAVVEVIEHLDPPRLAAFERVLFEFARPGTVVMTTPNAEYNVLWETLPAGRFRHRDHRFEWTRAQFRAWADAAAARHDYSVRYLGIGEEHEQHGPPTQMGVFTRG